MQSLNVLILYNAPTLSVGHSDAASEAGVLDSVNAAEKSLVRKGHSVRSLGLTDSIRPLIEIATSANCPQVVVNYCEGFAGRSEGESYLSSLLELLDLPYTGSGPQAQCVGRDKIRTKWLLKGAGVPTADFAYIPKRQCVDRARFADSFVSNERWFVKPATEDASLGIEQSSVVDSVETLESQVAKIHSQYGDCLVERYISGREFNVSIIDVEETVVLPLAEIDFSRLPKGQWPIVTYDAKWKIGSEADLGTHPKCPADVEPELAERIGKVALASFRTVGCRDYARIDLRVESKGTQHQVFVLEVNPNPDLSPDAGLARSLAHSGRNYDDFLHAMIQKAWSRRRNSATQPQPHSIATPGGSSATESIAAPTLRKLSTDDIPALVEMTAATKVFRPDEVTVAEEVLRDSLTKGSLDDYLVTVAELEGRPVGWSCIGRTPLTDATFDLYWIVVDPGRHRARIGKALLNYAEERARAAGGRWLLAETSGTPTYDKTRSFYERNNYSVVGAIPEFYAPGDARITYGKRL